MKTYEEVADKIGLTTIQKAKYLRYMRQRWLDTEEVKCLTSYATEWAIRFQENIERICSDSTGRRILDNIESES